MRTRFFTAFIIAVVFASFPGKEPAWAESGRTVSIAAVVNDKAVSAADVEDRMALVMTSSGMPNTKDMRERLRPQIIAALIEEQLKLQEAARLEIVVTQADIDEGFAVIAGQNGLTGSQFASLLQKEKVSPHTLQEQIKAQMAWSAVIQKRLRPQVSITDNEVDATLQRLKASTGKTQYLASEIFLPIESPRNENDVRQLSDRITRELIEGGASFQRLAQQFSQAAGASRGGDMGWVQEGQLSTELDEILSKMNEGELSQPIRSLAGYHILYLRKKSAISAATLPSREEIGTRMGMERLDRLQRRHLQDLKASAFIEHRV